MAGKIPGGFKREGRPSENETLVSRLIDRPIRPLFPAKNFKCETQVICTVLSHDMENNPDIVALIGASAALDDFWCAFLWPDWRCACWLCRWTIYPQPIIG